MSAYVYTYNAGDPFPCGDISRATFIGMSWLKCGEILRAVVIQGAVRFRGNTVYYFSAILCSWKYWWKLNLAVGSQIAIVNILSDFGEGSPFSCIKNFWRLWRQTAKPPKLIPPTNFLAIWYTVTWHDGIGTLDFITFISPSYVDTMINQ